MTLYRYAPIRLASILLAAAFALVILFFAAQAARADADQNLAGFLASFKFNSANTSPKCVDSIQVTSPACCSDVRGNVKVVFTAPGMNEVHALCWQQPTKAEPSHWGHDDNIAPGLKLDADGNGSFVFNASRLPHGPITVRIYAKSENNTQDYFELQLFNLGGVSWDEGVPKTAPPAAHGMKLSFADDFTGPLSISNDDSGRYWTHWGGGDGSTWPFREYQGPMNPFSQVGTYLRIHASKPAGTDGGTGCIASVHKDGAGITVKAPCYFECRLMAQNATGTWPAFWVTTNGRGPVAGTDEMDAIEGYGTTTGATNGIWTPYHVTTHLWGQTAPDWSTQKGPDGKLVEPLYTLVDAMAIGGHSSWSETFHTYGLLVTKTETVYYFDNIPVLRHPTGPLAASLPMGFIVNLALGSGWPVDLERYGNQSDMWIDYVRLYQGE